MIDKNNYKDYIKRFLNAETSLQEEKELYAWFARTDLPPEAEKWREMFGWYDSLSAPEPQKKPSSVRLRILPLKKWQWIAVAASVAVLFMIGMWTRPGLTSHDSEYLTYENCYRIKDGKKITDQDIVVTEFLKADAEMSKRFETAARRLNEFETRVEHRLTAMDQGFNETTL
ncbi:MAG: hypothetical protein NC039_06905 [Muribaculaceae bacterium]|nr:hypothetical protein [Muribaculaceae bacterium]